MSAISLLALTLSWVLLVLFLIDPTLFVSGPYQFGVFLWGFGAALFGGILGLTALGDMRKPLGFSASAFLVLWFVVLNGSEAQSK